MKNQKSQLTSISDVLELAGSIEVNKVLHNRRPDEFTVKLGNSIDLVATNAGQVGHAYVLRVTFLDERHSGKAFAVFGEFLLDLLQEVQVDVEDDLHVTG